jgi:ABC-type transport system involved in multi-copper enzyme maturation permease subunit
LYIGPVFSRELTITPRRPRIYTARTAYVGILLVLMGTSWLLMIGAQRIRDVGDFARFGMAFFQMIAPLQLALAVFSSALLAASAVALEKDRKTLILLLLTHMTNSELVLGKLLASVLHVLVLLAAGLPLFVFASLFGGISWEQVARVFAVTVASVLACGSLGSTIALWREKTFQSVAMTILALVLWLAAGEIVLHGAVVEQWLGVSAQTLGVGISPWRAVLEATRPYLESDPALGPLGTSVNLYLVFAVGMTVVLNGIAVAMVRVWNPSREEQPVTREDETWNRQSIWGAEYDEAQKQKGEQAEPVAAAVPASQPARAEHRTRHVWDNPIIWREIRTWAYGRKILVIRLGYLLLAALAAASLYAMVQSGEPTLAAGAAVMVPMYLLSLIMVNAQAVTSLTSEKDAKALDLLLVSDLTPKEFVYGKLGGVFYNTREMVLAPLALTAYLRYAGVLSTANLVYLALGMSVLYLFVAMLGVHAGMTYSNSRHAIATSLGTVFFLFIGVATCMWMMIAFSGSFEAQLPFLGLLILGGAGLYMALGVRNPSAAIGIASFACPLVTFYAITSFFVEQHHLAFVALAAAYGFTTVSMLIPAVDEFDVATGRTTIWEQ